MTEEERLRSIDESLEAIAQRQFERDQAARRGQASKALAIERKAFLRAFVIQNSVPLQDHDVLAIAVKHWDDIKERA